MSFFVKMIPAGRGTWTRRYRIAGYENKLVDKKAQVEAEGIVVGFVQENRINSFSA